MALNCVSGFRRGIARAQLAFMRKDVESERLNEQRHCLSRPWAKNLQTKVRIP